MARFFPLRVTDIRRETRDSVVVTLAPPPEHAEEFRFIQGQYLTFRRAFDGEELRRSYSICAARNEGVLRVGIKKVEGGWFSTWANEELKVGDTLEAMKPAGNFHVPLAPEEARHYLGFAGGSGITPVISIIKTALAEEPKSSFTLVYGNRSANAIMFREELEELKNRHMGRLSVIHILESEAPDIDLFSGRLDREKCEALFARWVRVEDADYAFICGPEPMMLAVADALKARGMAESRIKFELFASAQPGKARRPAASAQEKRGALCQATIILDGAARAVEMPKEGQSVLEAALAAKLDAPYACKAGVCSTCRAKVIEGEAQMEANYALEDYEVKRGYILTCQSYPVSDRLVVDYDQ
ncbi:1,2-phenylacetyl-CoA epoxidase subunit PaaE [Amphiplicatus metriothermophilus]|uniref:Ring-1,2-phenylacetyl-CoA epoxidase subunit PaaE n=1 Tax=Amphiplicatus metriothermophilus TaxID=1519374 RepID=A0A239PX22_9PROT|nr:1,2-phenylacetyl-CoA epoxidase subunit PaaE [Amphiplicatus metriothermophilus]MBB5519664.1 ring-1,2-phenylacetyl-CoA epoxidase subunit PaaE [Amphiplicatus metriothermophilus]SNT74227.1 ring-1,2-phenylacetyl-CoA epoxidase subunit PaaE [Amphiplicatus metriothermophilus]